MAKVSPKGLADGHEVVNRQGARMWLLPEEQGAQITVRGDPRPGRMVRSDPLPERHHFQCPQPLSSHTQHQGKEFPLTWKTLSVVHGYVTLVVRST
jgi:hypothetical protein